MACADPNCASCRLRGVLLEAIRAESQNTNPAAVIFTLGQIAGMIMVASTPDGPNQVKGRDMLLSAMYEGLEDCSGGEFEAVHEDEAAEIADLDVEDEIANAVPLPTAKPN